MKTRNIVSGWILIFLACICVVFFALHWGERIDAGWGLGWFAFCAGFFFTGCFFLTDPK